MTLHRKTYLSKTRFYCIHLVQPQFQLALWYRKKFQIIDPTIQRHSRNSCWNVLGLCCGVCDDLWEKEICIYQSIRNATVNWNAINENTFLENKGRINSLVFEGQAKDQKTRASNMVNTLVSIKCPREVVIRLNSSAEWWYLCNCQKGLRCMK